jgi:hypothetical protein
MRKKNMNSTTATNTTLINQSLEERVANLESLLLFQGKSNSNSSNQSSSALVSEVASLKKQLARAEYRIEHLCRALEAVKKTDASEDLLKLKVEKK